MDSRVTLVQQDLQDKSETQGPLVSLVSKELVELLEQLVTLDLAALLASLDSKEWQVQLVPKDSLVTLVLLVSREQLDLLECRVKEVIPDQLVLLDLLVHKVPLEKQARQVSRVLRVRMVSLDHRDSLVSRVFKANRDQQDHKASRDHRELLAAQEHKVPQETLVTRETQDLLGSPVRQARKVFLEQLVQLVLLVHQATEEMTVRQV